MSRSLIGSSRRRTRLAAGLAAITVLGGVAAGCGSSSSDTATAASAGTGGTAGAVQQPGAQAAGQAQGAATGQAQGTAPDGAAGMPPQAGHGAPPGMQEVTGTAAAKARAAALAKYPGTVERVVEAPDGSYVVHVITSSGEQHVAVSKAFQVTGTVQGGPPQGGMPPQGGTPPQGAPSTGTSSGSSAPA